MSSQRSGWRERLHANPSRMEQELAIKLQDNGIMYLDRTIALVYSLVLSRFVESPGDPLASLDLLMLGSDHDLSGLSCCGSVTSEVVGSGWTQVTGFWTAGVGSPGLLSLVPVSAFGMGPSRILSFVILSPLLFSWSRAERLLARVSCLRAIG